ncbi:hypothetical protein [Pontibacter sp. G13]|uniref:hypothetical protein n=1 Tax=Pontibacter sp. G13 TaxID=3074898 RepID=UPI002889FC77|nr:hypothetical protein [Pontibacter sp. G13]WNJ17484.1 hypothetical protein RJD25_21765 [Pontibacter sp. G13]
MVLNSKDGYVEMLNISLDEIREVSYKNTHDPIWGTHNKGFSFGLHRQKHPEPNRLSIRHGDESETFQFYWDSHYAEQQFLKLMKEWEAAGIEIEKTS